MPPRLRGHSRTRAQPTIDAPDPCLCSEGTMHLDEGRREALLLVEPPRDLVVCHHLQRDGRSTRLAHCCVCRLHEPTTDPLTARLGQHIEAVNVADAAGLPHEVRLVVEADHIPNRPPLILCDERERLRT